MIEQVILIGVDDTSMVGRRRVVAGGTGSAWADARRRPRDLPQARFGHRRSRGPGQALPRLPSRRAVRKPETDDDYIERLRKFVRAAPEIEMNDHRAIIVGVCEATRTFQSNPVVYTPLQPGQAIRSPGAEDPLVHPARPAKTEPAGRSAARSWPGAIQQQTGLGRGPARSSCQDRSSTT